MNRMIVLLLTLWAGAVCAAPAARSGADARVLAAVSAALPGVKPDSVTKGPIKGFYQVTFGPRVLYVSADGRYLITGDIYDMKTGTALTQQREQQIKGKLLAGLDEKDMIIFGSSKLPYTVTVFTDLDCGYCRRLHSQIAEYNKDGIRVRYLAFPRAGLNSASARKAVSVWCAPDRKAALTEAMRGMPVPVRTCNNPVAADYHLGREFGVEGTPSIMLQDGTLLPGYVPPAQLAAALKQMQASKDVRNHATTH